MQRYSFSIGQRFAVLAAIVCGAASAQAATTVPAPSPTGSPEVQALREAYSTLYRADHDYKGHRIRAMHAIEKACDLLGTNIRGDGKGHETQAVSDAQLRQAQQTVEQVRNGIAQGSQPKVLKLLDEAISQLSLALNTK